MHDRLVNAAWVDVVIQLESRPEREACHRNRKRHKVPVPHLKLLVATGHQLRASNVANNEYLQALPLVRLCHCLPRVQCPLRIECVEQVREASRQTVLTDEEEPNVQTEHAKLQPVDEPLLVVDAPVDNALPVNRPVIEAAILARNIASHELRILKIIDQGSVTGHEADEAGNRVKADRTGQHQLEANDNCQGGNEVSCAKLVLDEAKIARQ